MRKQKYKIVIIEANDRRLGPPTIYTFTQELPALDCLTLEERTCFLMGIFYSKGFLKKNWDKYIVLECEAIK